MSKRIVVIGAGPTGLGAAWKMLELGHDNFAIYERDDHIGGLSSSFVDDRGFTWDLGGHVIFSHFPETDRFFSAMMGPDYLEHLRESYVRIMNRWVPYPFQNNIRYLPKEAVWECVEGILSIDASKKPENFRDWIGAVFGAGIGKYFMYPYNWKVWATPLEMMQYQWIGERVSVTDLKKVLRNILLEQDEVAWGPNNRFKFQLSGGTGQVFRNMAPRLGDRLHLNCELTQVDPASRTLRFANGREDRYDVLISTMPVDLLVHCLPGHDQLREAAKHLTHNGVHVVGIGIEGNRHDTKSWMYFPEDSTPFYRVTNFHNYSYNNVPDKDRFFSLMTETSFSGFKVEDGDTIVDRTVEGLVNSGLLTAEDTSRIVTRYRHDLPYAYPIPTLGRDNALSIIRPALESMNILSRGRFGAWKYEVGNMDHSLKQGMEAVERILTGKDEEVVNARG